MWGWERLWSVYYTVLLDQHLTSVLIIQKLNVGNRYSIVSCLYFIPYILLLVIFIDAFRKSF